MRIEEYEKICCKSSLATFDPYDIWQTHVGFTVKNLFNHSKWAALFPAALLTLFDFFINNQKRFFYTRREYPIVRAWSILILLNLYSLSEKPELLRWAREHLEWLMQHGCKGYSGHCWGLGFRYPVAEGLIYGPDMPLFTMTPYVLEAVVGLSQVEQVDSNIMRSIYCFYENDLCVMEENDDYIVTSYSAAKDRRVVNAVSYSMLAFALFLANINIDQEPAVSIKIRKMYNFIVKSQKADGSWYYSPDGNSFIDCFHSCIVLKNIIKTNELFHLHACEEVIARGYKFIKESFWVEREGLFKRFAKSNKPSMVKFDLYDNAEMLNLAILMQDWTLAYDLKDAIENNFCVKDDIYSQIDIFGNQRNRNMLRWAVMPYLYALSLLELKGRRC
ncbi:MAG: hypothetical protein JXR80_11420 [Deltaproteobacteria bacterium]|nr:hypothetical protein [Deltaproteobacteria bacterium]